MLLKIYPDNPSEKELSKVVKELKKGGLIIFPTDTVYSIGCDLSNSGAIEKLARLKGMSVKDSKFSLICYDLSNIADYTRPFENNVFKLMKKALPGPFTFILNANTKVPKMFGNNRNKNEIGIRVPDNNIAREIVSMLGNPMVCTSVISDEEDTEYITDPELIYEKYEKKVTLVINGGIGENEASTIVNCTTGEPEVIREGLGILEGY
jgi:tRNA threonylcarbamoyl adenosine modification protein (Sua5/YciO/YrdC/YwlC family)